MWIAMGFWNPKLKTQKIELNVDHIVPNPSSESQNKHTLARKDSLNVNNV